MKRLFAIMAVLLLIGAPASAYAQDSAEGEITGQVINGTEGGGSVAGTEITLITYADGAMSAITSTTADGVGKFRFENVALEHTYMVSAKYMGVHYYYPVAFESGTETTMVEVGVCDVTASDQTIRIGVAHTIIEVTEENLKITEVYWLVNDGDMTYAGIDGALIFTLPEGAFGFEAPQELMIDYQPLEGNRIAYLVPFPPGERQLVYSYRLAKPETDEFTLLLKVDYPTDNLEIMITGENTEVAVAGLAPAEPVVADSGERFIRFQGKNLPRNAIINLSLSNSSTGGGFPLSILWVIMAAAIAGTTIYFINRKRRVGRDE